MIDDAIVVLENIFRHMEEFGKSAFDAAIDGTREIGLAVLATTLSLVAVFLPVAFMSGIVGRFMNSFGLTMSFAILISLLVAFSLTPMLSSRWLQGKAPADGEAEVVADGTPAPASTRDKIDGPNTPSQSEILEAQGHGAPVHGGSRERGFFAAIDRFYTMLLHFALKRRWVIVLVAVAAIGSMVPLFKLGLVPFNFLPTDDESQFQISIEAPQGTSLEAITQAGRRVTDLVKKEIPDVDYTLMTAGSGNENEASIYVRLLGIEKRDFSQDDAVEMARKKIVPALKAQGLLISVTPINSFRGGGGRRDSAQIQYVLSGPDLNVLREASLKAVAQMRKIPGVVEPDTNLVLGKPEIDVKVNRELAQQLGVSPADIAGALRYLVGGDKVTDYNEGGEQYEVHVRADRQFRDAIAGIGQLTVPSTTAGSVPLDQLVTFVRGTGPATIERLNRQRQVTLLANTTPGASQGAIVGQIETIIKGLNLGSDYSAAPVGTAKEQAKTGKSFMFALMLSLFFMYLVLAAQFESWLHPITILLSLPLTVPFAFWSLALFGQSINIFSMLGILVAFRRREKERDFANRPHQQIARRRHESLRRHCAGQPRPLATDSDDDFGVRRRNAAADSQSGRRFGNQSRHRLGDFRRPDVVAGTDAAGHAGRVFAVRRSGELSPDHARASFCRKVHSGVETADFGAAKYEGGTMDVGTRLGRAREHVLNQARHRARPRRAPTSTRTSND